MESVGTSDGRSYSVIPRTMGVEMLCLKATSDGSKQTLEGFIVPNSSYMNERTFLYEVLKSGSDVAEITGIHDGDLVIVDALARFADTYPISFINCRNAIIKMDAANGKPIALKGQIIVKVIEPTVDKDAYSGFLKTTQIDPYGEVLSIDEGTEYRGLKVGDKVSLTTKGTRLMFGNTKYFIYDYRQPLFKFGENQ